LSGPIHAVFFDLDNTLADRNGAFQEWARWFARDRLGLDDPVQIAETVSDLVALDAGGHGSKDAMFRTMQERFDCLQDNVDVLTDAFRQQLLTHLPLLAIEARLLLAALDEARIPWGIVSNGSASQLRKIEKLGIAEQASALVISDVVGVRKPDKAIFRLAAERLGVDLARSLFVGDHPEADIVGAANAGMQTAWLCHGHEWPDHLTGCLPDHVILTLADLQLIVGATTVSGSAGQASA
jgi:putative hydrolase of the HAD superfamily